MRKNESLRLYEASNENFVILPPIKKELFCTALSIKIVNYFKRNPSGILQWTRTTA